MILLIPILVFAAFLVICALMTVGEPLNPTRPLMSYDQSREYAFRLQKLIACKTVAEDGDTSGFSEMGSVMAELFPQVHSKAERMIFGDDCWLYRLPGTDSGRNILLLAHHDVRPASDDWKRPAFSGEVAEGKIWGRGTVDSKTNLFAMFSALEELYSEGFCPQCNVWIASSDDFVTGGDSLSQVAFYFRSEGIRFDFVLSEGGAVVDSPLENMTCSKCAMVAIHEKGSQQLLLTADSTSVHAKLTGGMKVTPTERMADFICAFRRENLFVRKMTPELEIMLKAMAPYVTFPLRLMLANLWLFKPLLIKKLPDISRQAAELLGTTCSFHDLSTEAGGKQCSARIVLRCVNEMDLKTDLTQLRTLATKHGIRVQDCGKSYLRQPSDTRSPAYGRIIQCIRYSFPDVPVIPYVLSDVTDCRFFADLSPCIIRFAPLRLTEQQFASIHGDNENVDITSVGMAVFFYRSLLQTYTTGPISRYEEADEELDEPEFPEEEPQLPQESYYDEMPQAQDFYVQSETANDPDLMLEDFLSFDTGEIHDFNTEEMLDIPLEEMAEDISEETDFSQYMDEESMDLDLNTLTNWEELL